LKIRAPGLAGRPAGYRNGGDRQNAGHRGAQKGTTSVWRCWRPIARACLLRQSVTPALFVMTDETSNWFQQTAWRRLAERRSKFDFPISREESGFLPARRYGAGESFAPA